MDPFKHVKDERAEVPTEPSMLLMYTRVRPLTRLPSPEHLTKPQDSLLE